MGRQGGRARGWSALLLVGLAAACVAPGGTGLGDLDAPAEAVAVWTVLPPGNGYPTGVTAAHRDDQRLPYERLDDAVADGTLTDDQLGRYFKDGRLELPRGEERTTHRPRPDVTIRWDRWGVPFIEGATATAVAYGAGWAVMEARGLVAELSRTIGRRGGQELGAGDLLTAVDPPQRIDYTDDELEAGLADLLATDPAEGAAVVAELDAYLDGVNGWIGANPGHRLAVEAMGLHRGRWRRADVIAALLTVVTGPSTGGGELANAAAFAALTDRLGDDLGRRWYHDLRAAEGPGTTHVGSPAPYPVMAGGADPDAVDPASLALPDDPYALAGLPPAHRPPDHSNAVAVTGDRTLGGSPVLVGGPQNGLTSPALLFEAVLSGGGVEARGVLLPGGGPYVFVGRNAGAAWTSTSGGTDQTDIRAERLCQPDGSDPTVASEHYLESGRCVPMLRPPGAGPSTVSRSRHGPVVARATVDGAPVAYVVQRASAGTEIRAALAVRRLNRNDVETPADFLAAIEEVPFSGNWFWVSAEHIAYALAGRHPVRAAGSSTELPTWGDARWDWTGYLDPSDQPRAVDPPGGCLHSWNNRIAPGWRTADDDWGDLGPHRVDLLADRVCGRVGLTPAAVVAAHTDAGAADLRGAAVVPAVMELLEGVAPPSDLARRVRDVLARWSAAGAPRRDRNVDLRFDDPAVGIMDALFVPLVEEVFGPALGDLRRWIPLPVDAGARTSSSSFGYGWYGLVTRDLARVRGATDTGALAPVACGGGDPAACRSALWRAIDRAATTVAARQLPWDAAHPERWTTFTVPDDLILFPPIVFNPVAMRWSNRPAYELVASFRPGTR